MVQSQTAGDHMLDLVKLENGKITIEIAVDALPQIVEGAWAAGGMDTRYQVTDPKKFAEDLVRELRSEAEDGTTCVHTMFDAAILEAIEQGADGIEEHEEQGA
jgi:hypothetical protein